MTLEKIDTLTADLISTEVATRLLGYHINYVRRLVREGTLRAKRFGHNMLLSREEVLGHQRGRMR
jgi:excisionase family DNA binding protein